MHKLWSILKTICDLLAEQAAKIAIICECEDVCVCLGLAICATDTHKHAQSNNNVATRCVGSGAEKYATTISQANNNCTLLIENSVYIRPHVCVCVWVRVCSLVSQFTQHTHTHTDRQRQIYCHRYTRISCSWASVKVRAGAPSQAENRQKNLSAAARRTTTTMPGRITGTLFGHIFALASGQIT